MELTQDQYERIEHLLPVQRGNVRIPNLQVLNAILYVTEHGCKWRGLPPRFGRWHTIYTRMSRWAKSGVLDRIFEHLQREQIVRVKLEVVSMDSTLVKVHPDGTGALKEWTAVYRQVQRWMDHQDSYGCRECSNSHDLHSPLDRLTTHRKGHRLLKRALGPCKITCLCGWIAHTRATRLASLPWSWTLSPSFLHSRLASARGSTTRSSTRGATR